MIGMSSLMGVAPVAFGALEGRAVLDQGDGGLAARAGENLQQFRVEGHRASGSDWHYNILGYT